MALAAEAVEEKAPAEDCVASRGPARAAEGIGHGSLSLRARSPSAASPLRYRQRGELKRKLVSTLVLNAACVSYVLVVGDSEGDG